MENLARDKKLLQALIEASIDGILVVDHLGKIVLVNPSCLRMFDYRKEDLINQRLEILLEPQSRALHAELRTFYFTTPHTRPMGVGKDLKGQKKNGDVLSVEVSLSYMEVDQQLYAVAIITDITARKAAEDALIKEKETARMYLDIAASIFVVLDKTGTVELINRKGCEILGYREEEVKGKNWFIHFLPDHEKERVQQVFDDMIQGRLDALEYFENYVLTKAGEERLIEWHNAIIYEQEQPSATLSSGIDITEKKRSETAVMKALIEGQEAERERIAKELHDGLGQHLTAMRMHFQALEAFYERYEVKPVEVFQKLNGTLHTTITEVKSISRNLMPAVLKDYGLEKALEYLCQNIQDSVKVQFQSVHMDRQVDKAQKIALYRVAQELINNAIKHAQAREVQVQLFGHERSTMLVVEDDGVGFDPSAHSSGFGLRNIETRVRALDGTITIDTQPGHGTIVTVELPMNGL